jgi:hypothetical protein
MPSLERVVARRLKPCDMRLRASVWPCAKVKSQWLEIHALDGAAMPQIVLRPPRLGRYEMNRERRPLRTIHLHAAFELAREVMH